MHQTTALSLNGIVHHRGQDTNGWPQGYTLGEQPLDFGYDLAGRITGLDQNGTAYDQSFGNDGADRLTSYTGYPALRTYAYDANANRTSETLGAMITSITHVAGTNRIHKVGTQAMAFDAAGNLSSYAGKTFTHGADGRLRSTTTGAGTVTYQYDGFGRRVSKSGPATLVPGGFVRYVYDAAHHLIGEYKADGTPIKEYVWIDDLPVAMIRFQGPWSLEGFAIETDHLGTPRLLTDATRAPRWRWTSPPFGEVLPEDDPSGLGAVTFNLRFPGQYYDRETGLHYNFNRYYDPGTGRYVQSDPIGLAGGWNTYAYVGGSPLMFVDPLGLMGNNPRATNPNYMNRPGDPMSIYFEAGVQASIHAVLLGINASAVALPTYPSGQICRAVTVCGRLGPGLYVGAGGTVGGGVTGADANGLSGWSVGAGGDIGGGPSVGGQAGIGINIGAGGQVSPTSAGGGTGKGGFGYGFSVGGELCYSWVACSQPMCE